MKQADPNTIDTILSICAEHTGADKALVTAGERRRPYPYTRKLAIFFLRSHGQVCCKDTASLFGFRTGHSIVCRYQKEIMRGSAKLSRMRRDIAEISSKIQQVIP